MGETVLAGEQGERQRSWGRLVSGGAGRCFGRETTSTPLFFIFYLFLAQVKFILTF
jgi:hypothetical protein